MPVTKINAASAAIALTMLASLPVSAGVVEDRKANFKASNMSMRMMGAAMAALAVSAIPAPTRPEIIVLILILRKEVIKNHTIVCKMRPVKYFTAYDNRKTGFSYPALTASSIALPISSVVPLPPMSRVLGPPPVRTTSMARSIASAASW